MSIQGLPVEITMYLLSMLNTNDLLNIRLTCQENKELSAEVVFKRVIQTRNPSLPNNCNLTTKEYKAIIFNKMDRDYSTGINNLVNYLICLNDIRNTKMKLQDIKALISNFDSNPQIEKIMQQIKTLPDMSKQLLENLMYATNHPRALIPIIDNLIKQYEDYERQFKSKMEKFDPKSSNGSVDESVQQYEMTFGNINPRKNKQEQPSASFLSYVKGFFDYCKKLI